MNILKKLLCIQMLITYQAFAQPSYDCKSRPDGEVMQKSSRLFFDQDREVHTNNQQWRDCCRCYFTFLAVASYTMIIFGMVVVSKNCISNLETK